MVGRKNLAKFHLMFKPVPNAVNYAEFFVKFDSSVYGGTVDIRRELPGERTNAEWPLGSELVKNGHAWLGSTIFCSLEGAAEFVNTCFHVAISIYFCDTFAKCGKLVRFAAIVYHCCMNNARDWVSENKKMALISGVIFLVVLAVAGYFAWQYFTDTGRMNRETVERIKEEVARIYELPKDEEPSVAQLNNPSSLEGQEFYKAAQKGDYLLIYQKEQLALIYRDATKKLVNVDHVEIGAKP